VTRSFCCNKKTAANGQLSILRYQTDRRAIQSAVGKPSSIRMRVSFAVQGNDEDREKHQLLSQVIRSDMQQT
jgi:hypothetical protein